MKVALSPDGRLTAVAKTLDTDQSDGESIGMMCFRGEGPQRFLETLEDLVWRPGASRSYYLAAIDLLAASGVVRTVSIRDLWWGEVDTPEDLERVRQALGHGLPSCRSHRRSVTRFSNRPLRRAH